MTVLRETLRALPEATFADAYEGEDAYLVVLDVPGVAEDGLTVRSGAGVLEITAEREPTAPEGYEPVRTERSSGIDARVPLPPDARADGVRTHFERGVLEVTVPKVDRSVADDLEATTEGDVEASGEDAATSGDDSGSEATE